MASQMGCSVCVKKLEDMTEPVTTSCGHTFCWPCIHLWVEARKEAVTEERETLEMARRCPGCRRSMTSLTPLFGFGLTRTEEDDEDIPRRPTEVVDPFLSVTNAVPPSATTTATSVRRRSARQAVPNPRYNHVDQEELPSPPHVQIFGDNQRSSPRGGQNVQQAARGRGALRVRGRAKVPVKGRSKPTQNLDQVVENVEEMEEEIVDTQIPKPAVVAAALSSSLVPGSRRTYQEVVTEYTRDHLIEKQTSYRDMVASKVVCMIREIFPLAWGAQTPGQAGKCLRRILDKAIRNRKLQKSIVSRSGVSGQKLTRLEEITDEIINFNVQIEGAEYIATKSTRMNAEEKKRKGQILRNQALTAAGPSRTREPRLDTIVRESLSNINNSVDKKLNSDNLARAEFELRKLEREAAREKERLYREMKEKEAKEEKEKKDQEQKEERKREREREDRHDQLTQMFQVKLINSLQRSEGQTSGLQVDQAGNVPNPNESEKLEINLKMKNEDDSESFPAKLFVGSFEEFINALCDFCSLDQANPVKVILFRMNRIMDLHLLEIGRTYLVEWKIKDGYSKVYLD